jgi:hypothetical protein
MRLKSMVLFFLTLTTVFASSNLPSEKILKQQIGQMLVVGFDESHVRYSKLSFRWGDFI